MGFLCCFRYLPISHPHLHKAMPECTLKPRLVNSFQLMNLYVTVHIMINLINFSMKTVTDLLATACISLTIAFIEFSGEGKDKLFLCFSSSPHFFICGHFLCSNLARSSPSIHPSLRLDGWVRKYCILSVCLQPQHYS